MANRFSIAGFLLSFINFIFTLLGLAIGSYGLYCLIKWDHDRNHLRIINRYERPLARALLAIDASTWLSKKLPVAWFVYLLLVLGASLIVISCFGYVAAATRSPCCLCFYSVLLVVLFVAQLGAAAFMFLNHNWKEDMPKDKSGTFNSTYHFFTLNWKIIRWVILGILALEVIAIVLALCLKSANRVVYDVRNKEKVAYGRIVRKNVEKKSNPVGAAPQQVREHTRLERQ